MSEKRISKKSSQRVQEKRQQIIDSAVNLFIKKGYERTSVREICKETGMTMGNLYDYIGKKEDLLFMVHDYVMKGIYEDSIVDLEQMEWVDMEHFRSLLKRYFTHHLKLKKESLLTLREMWLLKKPERKALLDKHRAYISRLKNFLDKGVKAGSLHTQNTQVMASVISYLIAMPVTRSWSLQGFKGKEEDASNILIDIIVKALV